MRCQNAKSLISQSFDESLLEYDRSRLEDHLQGCADCASHLRVLARGRELLQAGSQVAPSENFEWKVQLGIQKAMRESARGRYAIAPSAPFWRPLLGASVAVAVVVVAVGLVFLPRQENPGTQGPLASSEQLTDEPDLRGGQPVEIIDPIYVNSREGSFVSANSDELVPWDQQPGLSREELLREVQLLRRFLYEQQLENQRLHQQIERVTLTAPGASENPAEGQ